MKKAHRRSGLAVLAALIAAVYCGGCDVNPQRADIDKKIDAAPIEKKDIEDLRR